MGEIDVHKCKTIIAELSENAADTSIRDCIRSYDPSNPTVTIKKSLRKFHVNTIFNTLKYLSPGQNVDKQKKEILLDLLITKIKNFFPDFCQICQKEYCIKLGDSHFLCCQSCGQEMHQSCYFDLLASMNLLNEDGKPSNVLFKIPGICFLCTSCKSEIIDNEIENKLLKNETKTANISQSLNDQENLTDDTTPQSNESESWSENSNDRVDENSKQSFSHLETKSINNKTKTIICKFLRIGKCKHGIRGNECRFLHPPLCRKFINHGTRQPLGCNRGKNCDKLHPKMCFDSLRKGICTRTDCKFRHVKGTKRTLEVKENNSNYNNENKSEPQNFLDHLKNFQETIFRNMAYLNQKISQIEISKTQLYPPIRPPNTIFQPTQPIRPPIFQPTQPIHQTLQAPMSH